MSSGYHTVIVTVIILGMVLLFLVLRLLRLSLKRIGKAEETADRRDLLYDTLREQTLREQEATRGRFQAQRAYASLEELHQTVMEHLPIGVLVSDRNGLVSFTNPKARKILALETHDLIHLKQTCPPLFLVLSQLLADGRPGPESFQLDLGSGTRVFELSLCDLPEERHLLTVSDVTLLRRLEEQVRAKRDLELMGEMASGVTHEVKNALATISGHVQMLSYGDVQEHARLMMDEIDNLLRFVREFMQTSKGVPLTPTPVALVPWFEELASHWNTHPLGQVTVLPPPDTHILGEKSLLTTVVNNLILNALQAGTDQPGAVRLLAQVRKTGVVVMVEDDGPGFPAEIRSRIFTPFVSTKVGGTGLGLFQCRKIIMEHGGHLTIEHGPPTRVICLFPKEVLAPIA